jgi:NADP-dependent 3-hydroxy acid dehydrogenase YdfG
LATIFLPERRACDPAPAVDGPISVVAGASSDIGRAITRELVQSGSYVFALGRDTARLTQLAAEGRGRINPLIADLTRDAEVAAARNDICRHGRLDLLVLGSGIYERSRDPDGLARQFMANVHGPYTLLLAMLPLLATSKGLVVFISSTQALAASPGVGHFAATQHAMRALTDSTRQEFNPKGIRMTSIFLGRTATARQAAIFAMEERPYKPETLIQPEDVARLVVDVMRLAPTAEITEITMRPRGKSY